MNATTTYCQTSPIIAPRRIQRVRHVKGWRKPEGAVDCTRHKGGKWGNDYEIRCVNKKMDMYYVVSIKTFYSSTIMSKRDAAAHAVQMFTDIQLPGMDCEPLRGKTLMCWCALDMSCHVDSILRKANGW